MKRLALFSVAMVLTLALQAQGDQRVLVTINGNPQTVDEFMYIYQKNNQESQIDHKSVEEYLDMFINFKLKVEAAKELGIDTTESFRKELASYRSQATPRYMTDPDAEAQVVEKAYDRMKRDVKVRHIAIRCPENASKADKEVALSKIREARERVTVGKTIVKGKGKKQQITHAPVEDFEAVARQVSDDPSVADNGGMIGWIRPFRFVYSFEDMAYSTPLGQVSEVFQTPFGFHILRVEEAAEHVEVRAAHLMKATPHNTDSVIAIAKQQIDSLYEVAKSGVDFGVLARDNSDDRGSAMRMGDLGYFSKGQMVPEFEQTAFALANVGDISEPVKSKFGWHIIRLYDRRGTMPLDSIEGDIKRQIRRSEYQLLVEDAFNNRLKEEYRFTEEPGAIEQFIAIAEGQNIANDEFKNQAASLSGDMFRFADQVRTKADFAKYLADNDKTISDDMELAIRGKYNDFVVSELRKYEDSQLENKYADLRHLMNEYHDGILLFEVSLREVWDKASADTEGLNRFLQDNRQDFAWDEPRYKGFVLQCKNKQLAKAAKQIAENIEADSVVSMIDKRLNIDSIPAVMVEKGLWKAGDNAIVDKLGLKQKKATYSVDEAYPVVLVVGKKINMPQEPADERGKITSAYQDYLEKEWVKALREKYTVEVDEEVFNSIK